MNAMIRMTASSVRPSSGMKSGMRSKGDTPYRMPTHMMIFARVGVLLSKSVAMNRRTLWPNVVGAVRMKRVEMYRKIHRCEHPSQQHGLRMPPLSFESPFSIRISRVSAFLPAVTQQIHSLRASGVMSSHTSSAAGVASNALRQSAGMGCNAPPETCAFAIRVFYQILSEA